MPQSVADWCREKKVDLQELPDRSGLEPERVKAIVLGRWTPSPGERRAIAMALSVTADDITWGHTTPIQHLYGHGPG
jgi:hypothetical protein